jgi:hypothetical protein
VFPLRRMLWLMRLDLLAMGVYLRIGNLANKGDAE